MARQTVRDTKPETTSNSTATALLDPLPEAPALPSPTAGMTHLAPRKRRSPAQVAAFSHFSAFTADEEVHNHQAELFYLQKQIQMQTQMVFILEDGQHIQGVIEWYDRSSIKVRGKSRVLLYKSAIKYLYKAGEIGTAPDK